MKLSKYLKDKDTPEYLVSQVCRSGTSIGANINEGIYAQSRADFISKYSIALKESNETAYWLRKFYNSDILSMTEFNSIINDCNEIIALLTTIIKKLKNNNEKS
jgi:four helix bundle protein